MHPRVHRIFPRSLAAAAALLSAVVAIGCSRATTHLAAQPGAPAGSSLPDRRAQLFMADEMLRRGCYDCLRDALTAYEALGDDPTVGARARDAAVRASVLLAVRETELGLLHGGYIERARHLLGPAENASPELPGLVEIAEVVANGPTGFTRTATTDGQLAAIVTVARNQEQWATLLRNLMPQDLAASYLWLGLACGPYGSTFPDHDKRAAVLDSVSEIPLIAFKTLTP